MNCVKPQIDSEWDNPSPIKNISAIQAHNLLKNSKKTKIQIIDVRTSREFLTGHIKNAININYFADDFVQRLNTLDRNKRYMVYCRSGNRSTGAIKKMKDLKFTKIYHLVGGLKNWKKEGLPLVVQDNSI